MARRWLECAQRIKVLRALHGLPRRAVALPFALAHSVLGIVVPGARPPAARDDAAAMMRVAILSALWAALRGSGLLAEGAPVPA